MRAIQWWAIGLVCAGLSRATILAAETTASTNASRAKAGIYDSRVLAYAHFWQESHQQKLRETINAARNARSAGQTERLRELEAAIKAEQDRNHLQVFSTAPVDNVLAEMKDRVESTKREAGVSSLVSKWNEEALKLYPSGQQVDVTDLLLRDFKLTEQQKKVIEDLRRQKPLPLDKARELLQKGEL